MASKIIWINKLIANDFNTWKAIPNSLFVKIGIRTVFHHNFKPLQNTSQKISLFPLFYQELVSFWETVSENKPSCISENVGKCVWNNTYILRQDRTRQHTVLQRFYNYS